MCQVKPKIIVVLLMLAATAYSIVGAEEDYPNCCNAPGWNCVIYDDWVVGYYAYIDGACPAFIAQSVPPAGDQPASTSVNRSASTSPSNDEKPEYILLPSTPEPWTIEPSTPAEREARQNAELRKLQECDCAVEDDLLE